jgi:type IV pilus assembly protein PilV
MLVMRDRRGRRLRASQSGFTLIEVMVAVLILLFGLLGMAGVQVRATQAEFESYQRRQALMLVQDMVDRMQANRLVAGCYAFTDATNGTPTLGNGSTAGTIATPTSCTAGSLIQQAVADADLAAWNSAVFGSAEIKSGAEVGAMAGGRGCVSVDGTGAIYTISIAWQGVSPTGAPPANLTCGKNLYGNEALRRVVSLSLQVANLTGP